MATFDHGTGAAASRAVRAVGAAARALGLPLVVGEASPNLDLREGREAAWRAARYEFLAAAAAERGARIATGHTENDQVETVLMRIVRGSGARGLAALYAEHQVVRPFVRVTRAEIECYARLHGVTWTDDPSNASREFFRNRVRLDQLAGAPSCASRARCMDLLALATRAAALRHDVDAVIDERLAVRTTGHDSLEVRAGELGGLNGDSLRVLWGALAARVGLSLDRRGTRRIGEFTMKEPRAGWIPLSGGWRLEARRGQYRLYRSPLESRITPQKRGNRSVRQTGTALTT